ncbi:hypothetical protein V1519DRAFT_329269 [Lipomyces tetrasporus]
MESRRNFSRFEYDSLLSLATITTDPSDLNTLVRDHLSSLIRRATVSKLEEHGFSSKVSSGVQCHIDDEAASTRQHKGSRKIVDNGMQCRKGHCSYVRTCAIIGGPMQQYSTIQDDVRLLLYGTRYQAVILVGIEENPVYHSPVVDEAVECIRSDYGQEVQLARKGFWQAVEETPLGPYMYEKFAWVCKVSNLFLEVYKRHGRSHRTEVTRHIIVEDGKYVELGILKLNLTIGELAPIAEVRRSDIGNMPIMSDRCQIYFISSRMGDERHRDATV